MRHELVDRRVRVDQPRAHFLRMRRREAQPLDAGHVGHVFEQHREVGDFAVAAPAPSGPRYALTFWPSSVTSRTPWSARSAISVSTSSNGRDISSPRVYGTTQNVQYLLQPSMIETNAVAPSTRGGGRWSNFSISGNAMSTCGTPDCAARADHRRQPVQRLRAEHDIDVRRTTRRSPRLPATRRSRRRRSAGRGVPP